MNQEQRNTLGTGVLVLAVLVGASLVLSTHDGLRSLVFGGLLLLAVAGCVVESRRKKTSSTHKQPTDTHPSADKR